MEQVESLIPGSVRYNIISHVHTAYDYLGPYSGYIWLDTKIVLKQNHNNEIPEVGNVSCTFRPDRLSFVVKASVEGVHSSTVECILNVALEAKVQSVENELLQ